MRKTIFRLSAVLALGSFASGAIAQPMAGTCITDTEMHALVGYMLPTALKDVGTKCGPFLPETAYLRSGLAPKITALESGRNAAWPGAKSAFLKFTDEKDVRTLKGVSDKQLRPLLDGFLETAMPIKVGADQCGEINDIAEAMAPLSAPETVHLVSKILSAAARNDRKMRSCPRGAEG